MPRHAGSPGQRPPSLPAFPTQSRSVPPALSPSPNPGVHFARPFPAEGGAWYRRLASRAGTGARAGGIPNGRKTRRVRPPSRGAARKARRHYDRLCGSRTLRASGLPHPDSRRGGAFRRADRVATSRRGGCPSCAHRTFVASAGRPPTSARGLRATRRPHHPALPARGNDGGCAGSWGATRDGGREDAEAYSGGSSPPTSTVLACLS